MTDEQFKKLAELYGFAPSRALRELVEAVERMEQAEMTEEEISDLSREMVKGGRSVNWLCRAIERKLEEKNRER